MTSSLRGEPPDLTARIVYLPIRHHSPGCAYHVGQVIRTVRPAVVAIEGPRDATSLIRHLQDPRTKPPVAIFLSFVDHSAGTPEPRRHGAYYPIAAYSPELVALQTAAEVGATARFIDLTFPEMTVAEAAAEAAFRPDAPFSPPPMRSLQDEAYLRHSRHLAAACREAGARDPDDLWDGLFEQGFRDREPARFFHEVLTWCALARADESPATIAAEKNHLREAAMRAEIDAALAETGGPIVVVTGGFHTVVLPTTKPARPPAVKLLRPEDAGVHLMRYGFPQLDALNGYASGMQAPEFYQRLWEGRDVAELLVELARDLRERTGAPSVADVTVALEHVTRLARFRGHTPPTREDLLDGVRSTFVKGALDVEGVAVMAAARKLLAGERMGEISSDVGRPPLVLDFERTAAGLKVPLELGREHESTLDLYRSSTHRGRSRFFRRLALLEIPFARLSGGPDYVAGASVERVTEEWRHSWTPATESRLVEQSRYGASVEEAALAVLLERFAEAESTSARSDLAARLALEACRCGLHAQLPALLERTSLLVAADPSFVSVVDACTSLDLLRSSREPLEAHDLPGLEELVERGWQRAAFLVPQLAQTPELEEAVAIARLCAWSSLASAPAEADPEGTGLVRRAALVELSGQVRGNPALLGAADGLLYDDGDVNGDELGRRLAGRLAGAQLDPTVGARYLCGVMRAARSACWLEGGVVGAVQDALASLPEEQFIQTLPHLRLAFSDLTPRECDRLAAVVAGRAGVEALVPVQAYDFGEQDLMLGIRADRLVGEWLARDGGAPGDGHGD